MRTDNQALFNIRGFRRAGDENATVILLNDILKGNLSHPVNTYLTSNWYVPASSFNTGSTADLLW